MLKDIETDSTTDSYDIVNIFLSHNSYTIGKLEATSALTYSDFPQLPKNDILTFF